MSSVYHSATTFINRHVTAAACRHACISLACFSLILCHPELHIYNLHVRSLYSIRISGATRRDTGCLEKGIIGAAISRDGKHNSPHRYEFRSTTTCCHSVQYGFYRSDIDWRHLNSEVVTSKLTLNRLLHFRIFRGYSVMRKTKACISDKWS